VVVHGTDFCGPSGDNILQFDLQMLAIALVYVIGVANISLSNNKCSQLVL